MAKKKSASTPQGSFEDESAIDFETALAEIEQIVSLLESGDLGLTESLSRYETGVKRLKECYLLLDAAEQRVSLLSGFDADGNPVTEPMNPIEVRTGGGRKNLKPAGGAGRNTTPKSDQGGEDALGDEASGPQSVDDSPGLF